MLEDVANCEEWPVEKINRQIAVRVELQMQMLGSLYSRVLQSEIEKLRDALQGRPQ